MPGAAYAALMFTGVFKDRSAKERVAREAPRDLAAAAEQALAELLSARELRAHALSRQCELGPFLVDYVFPERSLIVELLPTAPAADPKAQSRFEARSQFLGHLGYVVHGISPQEILRQPQRVLAKLCVALESRSC